MTGRENHVSNVLIVGGGQAGAQTAINLADAGFTGSIRILAGENVLPYERPPLSKKFLAGETTGDELLVRPAEYWTAAGVEVELGQEVLEVDAERHIVNTADGQRWCYGTLVWATGGRPRVLPVPGAELDGVHQLRTVADTERLRTDLSGARHAVVIGGGFIGLEAAAAFRKQGLEVTVVETLDRLLARVTSPVVSGYFADLHRSHGVDVVLGSGVVALRGKAGRVQAVELGDGRLLAADVVLVGIGLIPNVEPLRAAGAECSNGVDVDTAGRTSLPDVLAVGDCANMVNAFTGDRPVRLESVQNVGVHARIAAATVMGTELPAAAVPWFWSDQYDVKFKTMGLQTGHDTTVVRGDPATDRFSVVYIRDGAVIALDAINNLRDYAQAKQLIEAGAPVDATLLADPECALKDAVALQAGHGI